jgi:uncharacterized protein (TIGR03089 family)
VDTLLGRFDAAVRADQARPLLTWYRPAAGARVELSAATAANWVAKAAGLFRDELDLQPGGRVHVDVGAHWLGCLLVLGIWRAHGVLSDRAESDLLVVPAPATADAGLDVVAVSTHPLAMPDPVADGVVDLARDIRTHPDRFSGPTPDPGDPARHPATTHADLLAEAERLGYSATDRVLADGVTARTSAVAIWCGVLAAGGSLVLVDGADDTLVMAERITRNA